MRFAASTLLHRRARVRRSRRGMSLTEVLVVIVIGVLLVALLAPPVSSILELEQRAAARDLSLLYGQLHDEAIMRNVTFRVAYDLRQGSYKVEVAESGVLIFDDPDARERWDDNERRRLERLDDEARAAYAAERQSFSALQTRFKSEFELPTGAVFGGIYTPQYGEMVDASDFDDTEPAIVYSYIFANGQAEHTVIHLVASDDPEDGYTVEIEPLSGAVRMRGEIVDWRDSHDFVPDAGPDLPSL